MDRKWTKRGQEDLFPGWQAKERGKKYLSLHNVLQSKKCKGVGVNRKRGIKGYRVVRIVDTPVPSPTLQIIKHFGKGIPGSGWKRDPGKIL